MSVKKLLLLALGICLSWPIRVLATGSTTFGFLGWNLFLAFVPLIVAHYISKVVAAKSFIYKRTSLTLLAIVWILFLPNAFYIITDLMHLNHDVLVNARGGAATYSFNYVRGDAVYLLDSVVLFFASLVGAVAGVSSIATITSVLRTKFSKRTTQATVGVILLLSSVGIYIGRFGRWNSWDALYQPWNVIVDTFETYTEPSTALQCFAITGILFVYQHVCIFVFQTTKDRPGV